MRTSASPALSLAVIAAFATSCSDKRSAAGPQRPALPPLQMAPQQAELDALAKAPPPLPEGRRKELQDLADIALMLVESDPRTLARAQRALLDAPDCAAVLEPALGHDKVEVRRRAAWLCGQSSQPLLQFPLLFRLKYETDGEAIVWVANSLQQLGNDTGLAWIGSAMNAESVQQLAGNTAIAILQERGVELTPQPSYGELQGKLQQLSAAWQRTGTRAGWQGPACDPAGLDHRIAAHLAVAQGFPLRPIDEAKFVLARCGALAVPRLAHTLTANEPYLRSMALEILVQLGPIAHDAGPDVLPLLQDALTASYAMRVLGEIGCQEALPHLRARLDDIDMELRAAAVMALGVLRDQATAPVFTKLLADPGETMDVRVNAAFALLCLGNDAAAESFLHERQTRADYDAATLAQLRERLATQAR